MVRHVDLGLNWANLAILIGAVIIPFPTATLADALHEGVDSHDARVAVALYALAAAFMSRPWLIVFAYLRRHPDLVKPHVGADYLRAQRIRPLTGLVLYGLSGVLGWFTTPVVGVAAIGVMIVYHALTSEGLRGFAFRRLLRHPRD
jgi:uncharacterized membrane protein